MTFKIGGFVASQSEKEQPKVFEPVQQVAAARKSLVQVKFANRGIALAYYNDQFDLKVGDRVYVDGKLEGQLGRVVEINYNFKIKASDYQKVIAKVDTEVHGEFYMAGSHFVTFDPSALPVQQVMLWFKAPEKEDEEFISGNDDSSFPLEELSQMGVSSAIAERGHQYYIENRVRYLSVNNGKGIAIVEGSECYAVEFEYNDGEISHLVCECPCAYPCKHEFTVMLQLRETLNIIQREYQEEYLDSGCFAAIQKGILFSFAVDGKEKGKLVL